MRIVQRKQALTLFLKPWDLKLLTWTKGSDVFGAEWLIAAGAYPVSVESFYSPGLDASPLQVTPLQFFPQQLASTHLNSWAERSTVRVKVLAQEHNMVSPVRT